MNPFRALHRPGDPFVLPTAWDHASATALDALGFSAVGTTSLGVAAAHGVVDGSGAAREPIVVLATELAAGPWDLSVDLEGGFSDDPGEVAELAVGLAAAGVAGVNLEDVRDDGRARTPDEHAAVISAVRDAAPNLFVNARTNMYWSWGGGVGETLRRIAAFEDAGADGVFVPGVGDMGELGSLVAGSRAPFNALLVPGGPTVGALAELGVARVSLGSWLYRVALGAALEAARGVLRDGAASAAPAPSYSEVQDLAV